MSRSDLERLVDAVVEGDVDELSRLLDAGVDANTADRTGNTALKIAVQLGRLDLVERLLAAGARPDEGNQGSSDPALFRALTSFEVGERAPLVERLLEAGADPRVRLFDGRTPLHEAVSLPGEDGLRCVRLLVEAGADPGAEDRDGFTPRSLAARDEVRALLARG